MPGIASAASAVVRNNDNHLCNGTTSRNARVSSTNGFWSKHPEELTYNQLQKFWSELSPQARQKLLKIDKQTIFEQARKNMYCARCHGLLLEGFLQIVMYGKSLQQEGICNHNAHNRVGDLKNQNDCDLCNAGGWSDDVQDPSVHPWGGLTATRNGMLTLLDCYLYTTSLKSLQNVFDSGRARERERELLYPDACGGDGRGWVSQEMGGYGRVHGTRESCALHTARLSVDTLVDFWSALGEETRRSLLRMKEEDFMERLVYRFESKRFCRDCRKNVIREFKELKEQKRIRRENRCTTWFCVADAAFQYQVSNDTIQADWHQTFGDTFGSYQYFEWAVGTGEGKSDILDFENVGLKGRVQVKGLDLSSANSCYITLRGWKMDGRCTELSVKAHALKGKPCVHCRLVVGDGFVSISRGDNIKRFFEHAEEAEEDEDDELIDKDGNEIEGEYSRPQKHAKSPELAREFLLDAATVIFKEQVEKAFREGTARQNSHSIFVCLSLKMLEERVHVACKEIITLEKQTKLLEEEEKEEERKERKRTKEKGKKLRRKERQREKDKNRGIKCSESNQDDDSNTIDDKGDDNDVVSETEDAVEFESLSSDIKDELVISNELINSEEEVDYGNNGSDPSPVDHFKYSNNQKSKFRKEVDSFSRWSDRRRFTVVSKYEPKKQVNNHYDSSRSSNGLKNTRSYIRNNGPKFSEKYESRSCNCKPYNDNRMNNELQTSRPYYRNNQAEYNCRRSRNSCNWDSPPLAKKVWEPLESHKKHSHNDSDYRKIEIEATKSDMLSDCHETIESLVQNKCEEIKDVLRDTNTTDHETEVKVEIPISTDATLELSNSENCSSCLSEGSSNAHSTEFSSSDSEDTSENLEGKEHSNTCTNSRGNSGNVNTEKKEIKHVSIGSKPQAQAQALPPLHNHNIHLPVFQASPMGYYHPMPWTPIPHPNQYVFASPVGYGVNGNPHFSPYGTLQYHHNHMTPAFQPVAMGPNLGVFKSEPRPEANLSSIKKPLESSGKVDDVKKTTEKCVEKDSFSLFHFGGPLALSNGDDLSSKINADYVEGDEAYNNNKNTTIEEYNLFASSNGIKFSFF